jgi:hypothetical protein
MQGLQSTSQRRSHAAKFAAEVRRAIKARGASKRRVCEATAIPRSNLGYYMAGRNMPTVEVAKRLADVLDWPRLLEIVIVGRTVACGRQGCERTFLYEGGKPKVYCTEDCGELARKMAGGDDAYDTGGSRLYAVVAAELEDARSTGKTVRRAALEVGLATYARADAKRHARFSTFERRIAGLHGAIDDMCRACEPEGLCRTEDCPLRAFSPLPLAGSYTEEKRGGRIRQVEGAWGPTFRPKVLAAIQEANAERWGRPGERERQSEATRARWAALTDEERAARGQLISVRRRAAS